MQTNKQIVKVPITKSAKVSDFLDPYNVSKYYYRMDIFTHKDIPWDGKTIVVHFPGAGVNAPYSDDNTAAIEHTSKGFMWCVIYYYQEKFKDPLSDIATTPLPWKEEWGDDRDFFWHLNGRALMVQSALDYVLNDLECTPTTANIYFTGKSRGGASLLAWSYLSRGYSSNNFDRVRLILNNQGYIGSAETSSPTLGWFEWSKTLNTLSNYFTFLNHKFIHNYNDNDHGYHLTSRFINSIPFNRLENSYFVNFPHGGHTMNWELSATIIEQDVNNLPYRYKDEPILNAFEQYNKNIETSI